MGMEPDPRSACGPARHQRCHPEAGRTATFVYATTCRPKDL